MVTFFLVNPTRKNSAISILVSFRGQKYRRSVGESIPVKMWNKTKKRVKATDIVGFEANEMLNKWETAALRTITHFKEYYHPPLPEHFFAQLDKEFYKDDTTTPPESGLFVEYLNKYIERYKGVRSEITIKKYVTTYNKLKEYEQEKRKKLRFEDINIEFYNDFQRWFYKKGCSEDKKGYSDNYFGTQIKIIKQAYREAKTVDKLHSFDDIEHKDFVATNKESENIYLTESELLKIHHLKITPELVLKHFPDLTPFRIQQKIESMLLVRDRFLIGAYTGLRVSDFGRLNEMNISGHIRLKTIKTGSKTVVPIHPVIQEILDNGFDASITVSDQKINIHIKEIAELAEITEKVLIHKHIAGKIIQEVYPKNKLVCTHTARRSFATNAYKAGVPTLAIMKITGHTKEATFLKYIKVSEEENADMLKQHPFFGGGQSAEPSAEPNNSNEIINNI